MMADLGIRQTKEKPKTAPKPSVRGKRRSKSLSEIHVNGNLGTDENKPRDQLSNKFSNKSVNNHVYGNLESIMTEMNNNSMTGAVAKQIVTDDVVAGKNDSISTSSDLPFCGDNKHKKKPESGLRPKPKPRMSLLRHKNLSTEDLDFTSSSGSSPIRSGSPVRNSPRSNSPPRNYRRTDSPASNSPRTDSPARNSPRTDSPTRNSTRTDSPSRDSPVMASPFETDSPKRVSPSCMTNKEDKVATDGDSQKYNNTDRSLSTSSQDSRHSLTRNKSYEAAIDQDLQVFPSDDSSDLNSSSTDDKLTKDVQSTKVSPEQQVQIPKGRGPPPPRPSVNPVGMLAAVLGKQASNQSPPTSRIKPTRPAPPAIAPKPSKKAIEQVKLNIPSSISTPNISQHAINKSEEDLQKHTKHHQSSSEISNLHDSKHDKKASDVEQMTQALSKLKSTDNKTVTDESNSRPSSQFYYSLDGSENVDQQANTERRKSSSVFYCDVDVSKGGTLKFHGIKGANESKPVKKRKNKDKKKLKDVKTNIEDQKTQEMPCLDQTNAEQDLPEQIGTADILENLSPNKIDMKSAAAKVDYSKNDGVACNERLSPVPHNLRANSPATCGSSDKEAFSDGSSSPVAPPRTKRDKRRSLALQSGVVLSVSNNTTDTNDSENYDSKNESSTKQVLCDTQLCDKENKSTVDPKKEQSGFDTNTSNENIHLETNHEKATEVESTNKSSDVSENIYMNFSETKLQVSQKDSQMDSTTAPSIIIKSSSDDKLPRKQISFPSQAELDAIYLPMSPSLPEGFRGYSSKRHSDVSMCSSTMSDDYTPMSADSVYLMMGCHGNGGRPSSWAGPDNQDTLTGINLPPHLDESRSSDDTGDSESGDDEQDEGMKQMIVESLQQIKAKLERKKRKVFCAAEEMMTSEANFFKVLKLINEDFRVHVRNAKGPLGGPVIPERELDSILKYLPLLQNFSQDLLRDLTERVENWDEHPKIADVFVKKGPFLKMYTNYIREFEQMCDALEEARKKFTEFDRAANEFEAGPHCCNLAIKHFMLKPIQRIPQYRLLLLEYQKHIVENSLDYEDTAVALKIVSEVADHANDSMAFGDNLKKLMEIQNSLIGQFEVIKPGRILLKSGELMKMSRKEMQKRMFFLFSDILLCTTPISTGYKYNSELPLAGMKVCKPDKEDFQNDFSIISTTRSFNLSASTPEERDEWISILKNTVTEYNQKRYTYLLKTTSVDSSRSTSQQSVCPPLESDFRLGQQAPAWVPDSRVSMCVRCHEEFTMTFRRHHCRACGKVFCGPCCDNRAPLRYQGFKQGRVCIDCFEILKKECEKWLDSLRRSGKGKEERMSVVQMMRGFVRGTVRSQGSVWGSFGKGKRKRPSVLHEVKAMESDVDMSGYLGIWENKRWKKTWFVLKHKVLYFYKASEDTAAVKSTPMVGLGVHLFKEAFQKTDADLVFQLVHKNVSPMVFKAKEKLIRDRWVKALQTATLP